MARATEAIEFYRDVFGARVVDVTEMGGIVVHAELDFGNGRLQLGEPNPDFHLVSAPGGEDDCYSIGLYCSVVDAVVARAEEAGATIREPWTSSCPATTMRPSATRSAWWSVMSRVEDLSEEGLPAGRGMGRTAGERGWRVTRLRGEAN